MANEDDMVYLEDLEPTPAERKREKSEKKALKGTLKSTSVTPVATGKRQISLTDMGILAPTKRLKTPSPKNKSNFGRMLIMFQQREGGQRLGVCHQALLPN